MEKYTKIGLPALIGALVLFVFAVKTFVNIGYGEAGVLLKHLAMVLLLMNLH